MEYYEAQKLKEAWGKKPCDHPAFEKIFYRGAFLTTYVCTQCGSEFTISQKLEFDTNRGIDRCWLTHSRTTNTIN